MDLRWASSALARNSLAADDGAGLRRVDVRVLEQAEQELLLRAAAAPPRSARASESRPDFRMSSTACLSWKPESTSVPPLTAAAMRSATVLLLRGPRRGR